MQRRIVRAVRPRTDLPPQTTFGQNRGAFEINADQIRMRRRLNEVLEEENQEKVFVRENPLDGTLRLRQIERERVAIERRLEDLAIEEAIELEFSDGEEEEAVEAPIQEITIADLYRARRPSEEVEEEQQEPGSPTNRERLDELLENMTTVQLGLDETDPEMDSFLERLRTLLTARNYDADSEELKEMLRFITGDAPYQILRFFAVVYRGIVLDPGNQRLGRRGRLSFNAWKANIIRNLRAYMPDTARDFESSNVRTGEDEAYNVIRAARGTDRLLYRFTADQINYAMSLTIDLLVKIATERALQEGRVFDVQAFRPAAEDILTTVHMGQDYRGNTMAMDANSVATVWAIFFNVLRNMRAVFANGITLPDVILAGTNYRSEVINGERVSLLQAYPFLITKQRGFSHVNAGRELMMGDTLNKIRWMINSAKVKDLQLKVRVKMLLTKAPAAGVELNERPLTEEKFLTLTLDPITLKKDPYEAEQFREIMNREDDHFREVLEELANATREELEEWFMRNLLNELQRIQDKYHDLELLEDGDIDLESIFIDYINIIGIEPLREELPQRHGGSLSTAFCQTASQGVIRKLAMFSECSSLGICLYEALWTWNNLNEIRGKMKRNGLSYWSRESREKLMLEDFSHESEQVKLMSLHGNVPLLSITFGNIIPIITWESDEAIGMIDRLEGQDACLVVFDNHIFCANAKKVKQALLKRAHTIHIEDEEKETDPNKSKFLVRPRYTKTELDRIKRIEYQAKLRENPKFKGANPDDEDDDDEEPTNYFLDIETSIDPKTGKFTPYLICVVGESEQLTWWGEDCKIEFIEWLKTKLDSKGGIEVGHNHKPKRFVIWTFNGEKFDLVFLIRLLVTLPKAEIVGSFNSLKGLKIDNITFYDFPKISTGIGSLKAQAKHYKTEAQKIDMDHEVITDQYMIHLNEQVEKGDVDAQLKKAEIIHYCINDCIVLMQCVEAYKRWIRTNLSIDPYVPSAAGLALRYWATHHNPAKIKDSRKINKEKAIHGLPKHLYPIFKQSYKGGIVAVLKKTKRKDKRLQQNDMNSCYSSEMYSQMFPTEYLGEVKYSSRRSIVNMPPATLTDYFLYQVTDLKWKDNTHFPTIPKKTKTGLNHCINHSPIDYIWGKELKLAMSTGDIERGYISREFQFRATYCFKGYIEELYMKRRRECKLNGDKASDKFYKILLNSLYGKFGQKLYPKKVICNDAKLVYYAELVKGVPEEVCPGVWMIELDDDEYDTQIGSCIQMASYTTACSRVALLRPFLKTKFKNVYYFDTDCAVVDEGTFDEELISASELGKWDTEKSNISEYYAPAKKMYYMKYGDGDEVMKSKGITPRHMLKEDYITLCEEGVLKGKVGGDKWIRHKEGYVTKQLNIKDIKVLDSRFYYNNGLDSMAKFE